MHRWLIAKTTSLNNLQNKIGFTSSLDDDDGAVLDCLVMVTVVDIVDIAATRCMFRFSVVGLLLRYYLLQMKKMRER